MQTVLFFSLLLYPRSEAGLGSCEIKRVKHLLSSLADTRPLLPPLCPVAAANGGVLGDRTPEHRGAAQHPLGPSSPAVSLSQPEPARRRLRCCTPVYALA